MKRVRLTLLLLAAALALPVVLLVARALESVEFERRVRHETVAARVFDEMERVLSRFLEQEEARPIEEYRFYSVLAQEPGASPASRVRSPLSHPSALPFVVGHFQIDPDGSPHSPLQPRDMALAESLGDWPAQGEDQREVERALAQLADEVTPFWERAKALRSDAVREAVRGEAAAPLAELDLSRELGKSKERLARVPESIEQERFTLAQSRPGPSAPARSTMAAQKKADTKLSSPADERSVRDEAERADAQKANRSPSVYEVLESFNLGARQRMRRKQVVTEKPREKRSAAEQKTAAPASPYSLMDDLSSGGKTEQARMTAGGGRSKADEEGLGATVSRVRPREVADREAEASEVALAERPIRIVLDPMAGHAIDAEHLMLYRTVLVDEQGYRQGLLIDKPALGQWLEQQVIQTSSLARSLEIGFGPPGFEAPHPDGYFVSRFEFAEPFDSLQAQLALAPLAGMSSATTIYSLAALLSLVAVAGLAAVYRMVSVVVHFAERRNNFVAAVSHELKTPLTAIRMYGEMLRDGMVSRDDKRQEYYETISDESERLSRLIDNVLEFSRLEKGRREVSLVVGSLGDVVGEIAAKLRPHVEREGFSLEVDVEASLPAVRFDRDALVQMIFNLVDNAMKYARGSAPRGSSVVHKVVLQCGQHGGGGAFVSVRDFGPGVARQHLKRVFEPFYRGEDELTRTAKGSGIGLALVKELGESMNAVVRGENADGGGFRVSIEFQPPCRV